jgi:hypothetical protein
VTAVNNDESLADDLLNGTLAIANFLGWKKRETEHAVQHGRIPVFRIGVKIFARKSELKARLTAASYKSNGGAAQ